VDGLRRCRDRGRLARFKRELDSEKTDLEDRDEKLRDVMRVDDRLRAAGPRECELETLRNAVRVEERKQSQEDERGRRFPFMKGSIICVS
jgi:hypothetical protein